MKKISRILILMFCVLLLCSCKTAKEEKENIYQVYHISNTENKVLLHDYEMQATVPEEMLNELLTCLAATPEKLEYKAPFSMGFQINEVEWEDGKVTLDVDAAYYELAPMTEVLVRAAIVRTLTQLEGVNYVGITVDGNQLFDSAGELVSWMNAEQFINNNGNEINTYELVKVKLYFANETGDKLITAYREKHYSTNRPLERFVVEELIAGPSDQNQGIYPAINPQTKIINVMTKDGICYVNLDANFLTVVNNVSIENAVYSIVNSLVELSNVNKVQILINGEVPSTFSIATFERNMDHVITLDK